MWILLPCFVTTIIGFRIISSRCSYVFWVLHPHLKDIHTIKIDWLDHYYAFCFFNDLALGRVLQYLYVKTEGKERRDVERVYCEVGVSLQILQIYTFHLLVSLLQEFRCPDCGNFFLSLGLSGFEITQLCPGNRMQLAHRNSCIPDYVDLRWTWEHESMSHWPASECLHVP